MLTVFACAACDADLDLPGAVVLPCLHALCALCLQDIREDLDARGVVPRRRACFVCHESFDADRDVFAWPARVEAADAPGMIAPEMRALLERDMHGLDEHRARVQRAAAEVAALQKRQQAIGLKMPRQIGEAFERLRRTEPEYGGLLPLLHARRDQLVHSAREQLAADVKTTELQMEALDALLGHVEQARAHIEAVLRGQWDCAGAEDEWVPRLRARAQALLRADASLLQPAIKDTLYFTLNNCNGDAWGVPVDQLGYVGRLRDFSGITQPQLVVGYRGSAPAQFFEPTALAASPDGRLLVVVESMGARLQFFEVAAETDDAAEARAATRLSCQLVRVARGLNLSHPTALAATPSCVLGSENSALAHVLPALWVCEYNQNRVVGVSMTGKRLPERVIACRRPMGVAVALADGSNDVFVASEEGAVSRVSADGTVTRWTFNARTARQIREQVLGLRSHEHNDVLDVPRGLCLAQPGEASVVVSDSGAGRLVLLDAVTGRFQRHVCSGLQGPTAVACLEPGFCFIAETSGRRVSLWTLEGTRVASWGGKRHETSSSAARDPTAWPPPAKNERASLTSGDFRRPSGVAVLAGARVAVSDHDESCVQIF